jgi:hypothetical protein
MTLKLLEILKMGSKELECSVIGKWNDHYLSWTRIKNNLY